MATASILQENSENVDSVLCRRCQAFDIQAFSRDKTQWQGYRVSEIASSAASGCPFCSYLARCLDDQGFQIYTKSSKAHWIHFKVLRAVKDSDAQLGSGAPGLNITHLQVFRRNGVGKGYIDKTPLIEFHVVADPGDPASTSGDVVGRYVFRDASSQGLVEDIRSWIAICADQHPKCSLTLGGRSISPSGLENAIVTPLPTRCLEVTANSSIIGGISIRLVKTAKKHGSYTTLSHRWPTPPRRLHGATTSENYGNRLAGKESLESTLPRHFYDACMLTLRLGYTYIWIDAVCIIQGTSDPEAMADWAHEAAQMASYYQNSGLTIAATYGDDTTGLFYAETSDNFRPLIRLPYRSRPDSSRSGSISQQTTSFYLIPSDCYYNKDYEDYVNRSDLLTRGWVFQEWILSRRILCFAPTNVYFQCIEEFPHNEDGRIITIRKHVEGQKGAERGYVRLLDRNSQSDQQFKGLNLSNKGYSIYHIWLDVVEAYTKLNLTRPETDRLMGLVGIADEFGRALVEQLSSTEKSHTWVGGLWLEHIFLGLLWEPESYPAVSMPHSTPDWHDAERIVNFPSWSWASRRHAVYWRSFGGYNSHASCEVRNVRNARAQQPNTSTETSLMEGISEDLESLPMIGGESDPAKARLVDPIRTFPVLCIQARLISILIREKYENPEDREVASLLSEGGGPGCWRKVALPSAPGRTCGWISLDIEQRYDESNEGSGNYHAASGDPIAAATSEGAGVARNETHQGLRTSNLMKANQQQAVPREEICIDSMVPEQEQDNNRQRLAEDSDIGRNTDVFLVTTGTSDGGGHSLGYSSFHHPVYNVVCLKRYIESVSVSISRFERIGVGRLFGREVQQLFKDTEPQELELF